MVSIEISNVCMEIVCAFVCASCLLIEISFRRARISFCTSLACLHTHIFLEFASRFFELPNDEENKKSNMDDKEVSSN